MDVFSPQKRSEVMARVRGKDTQPELRVRSHLHRSGLRYRIHDKRLPGTPDLSFPSRRIAIFVNGCFWHGHDGCRKATIPATRSEFWCTKIDGNIARDQRNQTALEALGWKVRVVWQCSITSMALDDLTKEIRNVPREKQSQLNARKLKRSTEMTGSE